MGKVFLNNDITTVYAACYQQGGAEISTCDDILDFCDNVQHERMASVAIDNKSRCINDLKDTRFHTGLDPEVVTRVLIAMQDVDEAV